MKSIGHKTLISRETKKMKNLVPESRSRSLLKLNPLRMIYLLFPTYAFADFPSSIQSLVTGVLGGILPAVVMYEAGLAGLAFARKMPDAKEKAETTAMGAIAVLGINGVWAFLKGHIR